MSWQKINIEKIKHQIVTKLKSLNIEKIILFGSYANGTYSDSSDLDIYVVTSDDFIPKSWKEKSNIYKRISREIRDIRDIIAIDLIVHTKKMDEKFLELNKPFASEIYNGEVLWSK
jgi:predicted nucleotidyltransferase